MKCLTCGSEKRFEKKEVVYSSISNDNEVYDVHSGDVNMSKTELVYCLECGEEYFGEEEINKLINND